MRISFLRLALAMALVVPVTGLAPPLAQAAAPSPDNPRRVQIEAGTHVGYRFADDGTVLDRKSATLAGAAIAHTTRRESVDGRGTYLSIVDGIWAGYLLRESTIVYVEGVVGSRHYEPARDLAFPAGTIVGYRFDAGWRLEDARIGRLGGPSSASTDRFAVINGQRFYHVIDGGWAGTWVPRGGTFAVRALDCRTAPRADRTRRVVRTVSGAGREVALTFDMGGRLDPAMSIMRYLLLNGVCTTLFPTGSAAQTDVGTEVLAMARAYPQVFEVGNHTMWHCNLVTGENGPNCPQAPPTTRRIKQELRQAATIIQELAGQSPIPYWRPPFGAYNTKVLDAAASIGYTTTAMWGIDTIDWRPPSDGGPTAAQIGAKVVDGAVNGTVVLMHLGGWNTRDALPWMLHGLRGARDLAPTSLSDLLDRR